MYLVVAFQYGKGLIASCVERGLDCVVWKVVVEEGRWWVPYFSTPEKRPDLTLGEVVMLAVDEKRDASRSTSVFDPLCDLFEIPDLTVEEFFVQGDELHPVALEAYEKLCEHAVEIQTQPDIPIWPPFNFVTGERVSRDV